MCGRFTLSTTWDDLKKAFPEFDFIFNANSPVSYNISPSQNILTATAFKPQKTHFLKWGLVPSWSKDDSFASKLINTRSETIFTKPSFKQAIKHRRCLIFTTGFYEWKKIEASKQPFLIQMKSKIPFTFGGIWETWKQPDGKERNTCSIITTAANSTLSKLHYRMPLIISKHQYQFWLDHVNFNEKKLTEMMQPYENNNLEFFPVSKKVNSVKNNSLDCIEKVG